MCFWNPPNTNSVERPVLGPPTRRFWSQAPPLPHERQFFRSDDLRVFVPFGRGAVHGKICVQGGGLRSRSWSREGQVKELSLP